VADELLGEVSDSRVRQKLFDTSKRLAQEPEKQGKPLRDELIGLRGLRAVGQRYRIIYEIDEPSGVVFIRLAWIRKEKSRNDVYELAKKLIRLRLVGAETKAHPRKKK
jgi:mRNA interferase RelE/StbE